MDADISTDLDTDGPARYIDRRLAGASAALMTGGFLLWLAGATAGTAAVVSACRRYVEALEEPPRETARRRWGQVRQATRAGYGAWQEYDGAGPAGKRVP